MSGGYKFLERTYEYTYVSERIYEYASVEDAYVYREPHVSTYTRRMYMYTERSI